MPGESISQIPQQANVINGPNDLLMISQWTGNPSAPYVTKKASAALVASAFITTVPASAEYFINGGGVPIIVGLGGPYMTIPFNGTILSAEILGDKTGSSSVDIWRCTYSQFDSGVTHPVVSDSITGGNPLTITASDKSQSTLAGWSLAISAGDILAFDVLSNSVITRLTISITMQRSLT